MTAAEEIFEYQVSVVSGLSNLSTDVVRTLLKAGWVYNRALGKADTWVRRVEYPKFEIKVRKEDLDYTPADPVSVIMEEMRQKLTGRKEDHGTLQTPERRGPETP